MSDYNVTVNMVSKAAAKIGRLWMQNPAYWCN